MSAANPIDALFHAMVKAGASDLHLTVGSTPIVRTDGRMVPLEPAAAPLAPQDLVSLLGPIMPEKNRKEFAERHDTDFAYKSRASPASDRTCSPIARAPARCSASFRPRF